MDWSQPYSPRRRVLFENYRLYIWNLTQRRKCFGRARSNYLWKVFPNDVSRTKVEIDGTYCEVTRTNFNTITCKTGPHYKINLEDHYKGGAGLYCKGYDHGDNILWENSIPSTSSHYDESTSKSSIHGYFKPPKQENILFIQR